MPMKDQTSLLVSLTRLSINCYPTRLDYIDQIFGFTKDIIIPKYKDSSEVHTKQNETNLQDMLFAPVDHCDIHTLITLKHFQPLLALQTYSIRRTIILDIIKNVLENEIHMSQPEQVDQFLDLCHVMKKDETSVTPMIYYSPPQNQPNFEDERDEYGWIARLVHLFYSENEDTQFLVKCFLYVSLQSY
jgi:vacuolar protein sorting-associated protein 35